MGKTIYITEDIAKELETMVQPLSDLPQDIKDGILKSKEEAENLFKNTIIKDRTEADEITKRFDEAVKAASAEHRTVLEDKNSH